MLCEHPIEDAKAAGAADSLSSGICPDGGSVDGIDELEHRHTVEAMGLSVFLAPGSVCHNSFPVAEARAPGHRTANGLRVLTAVVVNWDIVRPGRAHAGLGERLDHIIHGQSFATADCV